MTEPHVAEEAIAYWSGELSPGRRAVVETHLSACPACRAEFDAVQVAMSGLSDWPQDPRLPAALEDRLIRSFRPSVSRRWPQRVVAVLALALVGGAGFAAGRVTSPASVAPRPSVADSTLNTYLLLLEEAEWPQRRPSGREGYSAWAGRLRAERRLVSAEKLTDEPGFRIQPTGRVLRPGESEPPANVSGWFLLRARTYDEAIALARSGPHLRYGSVLVRQVE